MSQENLYVRYYDGSQDYIAKVDKTDGSIVDEVISEGMTLTERPSAVGIANRGAGRIQDYDKSTMNLNWEAQENIGAQRVAYDDEGALYYTGSTVGKATSSGVEWERTYDKNGNGFDDDTSRIEYNPNTGEMWYGGGDGLFIMSKTGSLVTYKDITNFSSFDNAFVQNIVFAEGSMYLFGRDSNGDMGAIEVSDDASSELNSSTFVSSDHADRVTGTINDGFVAHDYQGYRHYNADLTIKREVLGQDIRHGAVDAERDYYRVVPDDLNTLERYDPSESTQDWTNPNIPPDAVSAETQYSAYPSGWYATISGTATQGGSGVSGAKVYIIDTGDNTIYTTTTTDSNGDWSKSLPSGMYHIVSEYDDGTDQYNVESYPFISV